MSTQPNWLQSYYFSRAAFSIAWVAAAVYSAGQSPLAAALLVIYPAWDAIANYFDARANGGLAANRSQVLNVAASSFMTLVVIIAIMKDNYSVLAVYGIWAILSGLLQLYTGVRRWPTYGAQWVMILSGAQSMLAGIFMIMKSLGATPPSIVDIAPYAGFGAFYFLLSAFWLSVKSYRSTKAGA
jgi:hypothetical protein